MPGNVKDTRPFGAIATGDTVRFAGTEPFWGGRVFEQTLVYETPENPDGARVPVERFAGRGGISWTGTLDGKKLALLVTEGACSDGMSDRRYPFVATLQIGDERRDGCAWIEGRKAAEDTAEENPDHGRDR